jgi:hypothetical protein
MDISETLSPDSDQLDAIDLANSGPRVFTITKVSRGKDDQPVDVHLAEFSRVWRPGKSMRRVLAACWGVHADEWAGRRVELFCDPKVQFGGSAVGGTRISRLSHIDGTRRVPLLVSRGKSATYTVEPLPDDAPTTERPSESQSRIDELRAEWFDADPDRRKQIEAEVAELSGDTDA